MPTINELKKAHQDKLAADAAREAAREAEQAAAKHRRYAAIERAAFAALNALPNRPADLLVDGSATFEERAYFEGKHYTLCHIPTNAAPVVVQFGVLMGKEFDDADATVLGLLAKFGPETLDLYRAMPCSDAALGQFFADVERTAAQEAAERAAAIERGFERAIYAIDHDPDGDLEAALAFYDDNAAIGPRLRAHYAAKAAAATQADIAESQRGVEPPADDDDARFNITPKGRDYLAEIKQEQPAPAFLLVGKFAFNLSQIKVVFLNDNYVKVAFDSQLEMHLDGAEADAMREWVWTSSLVDVIPSAEGDDEAEPF